MGEKEKLTQEVCLMAIEELKEKLGTTAAVYAGTVSMQGWKPGKGVTESDYQAAVESFLHGSRKGE